LAHQNPTKQAKSLTVGQVVGAYKSLVAVAWLNHIKENDLNRSGKIWQQGFNDHIIRLGELEQKTPLYPQQSYET